MIVGIAVEIARYTLWRNGVDAGTDILLLSHTHFERHISLSQMISYEQTFSHRYGQIRLEHDISINTIQIAFDSIFVSNKMKIKAVDK
jgi:hypothetical protein